MDYSKGKIYRIINIDLVQYYGSTIQDLEKRFNKHKNDFNAWCIDNTKKYCSSYEVLNGKNVEIELVYDCPCSSKAELLKCEQVFISNDNCVNKRGAFMTKENQKKYYEAHKEYQKKYYVANKEKYNEKCKEYYEANKEKIKENKKKYREAKKQKTI